MHWTESIKQNARVQQDESFWAALWFFGVVVREGLKMAFWVSLLSFVILFTYTLFSSSNVIDEMVNYKTHIFIVWSVFTVAHLFRLYWFFGATALFLLVSLYLGITATEWLLEVGNNHTVILLNTEQTLE